MDTSWMKWILIIDLMIGLRFRSALAEVTITGISECYACSSLDTVGCGGDFDPNAEGVSTVACGGYCYKTTYDYIDVRAMDRGCEPSNDCPGGCFGNDCTFCCQGELCNGTSILTAFSKLMSILALFATMKNIWIWSEN